MTSDLGLAEAIGLVSGRASAISRLGVVTAINTTAASLTVDINPGDPTNPSLLTGIRWFSTYTPAVGDLVGLIAIGSGWWVLGKNSYDMRQAAKVYGQAILPLTSAWQGTVLQNEDMWTWETLSSTQIPRVGLSNDAPGLASQDLGYWALLQFPKPSDIPSGAVIEASYLTAKVSLGAGSWDAFSDFNLGAHSYSTIPAGAPSTFGDEYIESSGVNAQPWTMQFALPSAVASALAAGTAKGVVLSPIYVYALAQFDGAQIIINYSTTTA